ncbi:hypothetical protein EON63_09940, partial [archaeon]
MFIYVCMCMSSMCMHNYVCACIIWYVYVMGSVCVRLCMSKSITILKSYSLSSPPSPLPMQAKSARDAPTPTGITSAPPPPSLP